jgi:hypothetical protein
MIAIQHEMVAVENGEMDPLNNPLKNAPHPAVVVCSDTWERPYSREQAAFPSPWVKERKFWPAVGRIDNVWGDRNLFLCSVGGLIPRPGSPAMILRARNEGLSSRSAQAPWGAGKLTQRLTDEIVHLGFGNQDVDKFTHLGRLC